MPRKNEDTPAPAPQRDLCWRPTTRKKKKKKKKKKKNDDDDEKERRRFFACGCCQTTTNSRMMKKKKMMMMKKKKRLKHMKKLKELLFMAGKAAAMAVLLSTKWVALAQASLLRGAASSALALHAFADLQSAVPGTSPGSGSTGTAVAATAAAAAAAGAAAGPNDYLAKYFAPDEDGFTIFDYDGVGLDAQTRMLSLKASHHLGDGEVAPPRSESQDVRASLVPRVVAAKQFGHFAEIHQTCPTFPFCNHIPAPPPILPNPADFVVRNTIAQLEGTPTATKLPAAYWNAHKLPLQAQMADQDQSELPSMEKGRDLKLPPQLRGDPHRWLPPPKQFPLYRHAIGNIRWNPATEANSGNIIPKPPNVATQDELETLGDLGPVPQDVYQPINIDSHTDNSYNNGPVPVTDIDGPVRTMSPASEWFRKFYKKDLEFPPKI